MAAIVQRDPYQKLARKIGYSVGLEELVGRVKMLVDVYVAEGAFPYGAFESLVAEKYGRKNATEHFANFYGALNLVRVVGRSVEPLYQLDSLSILRRLFIDDDAGYDEAVRIVLSQCILEEDADIFLNGLIADFRPDAMEELLTAMVRAKVELATADMRTPALVKKIRDALTIKNQSGPRNANGDDSSAGSRFARRTTPLDAHRRTMPLSPADGGGELTIPADYLRKTSATRKGWAEDLRLFEAGAKTRRGVRLLNALSENVISREPSESAALFWGYKSELDELQMKLQIKIPNVKPCEAWDMLEAIVEASREDAEDFGPPPDPDETVELLSEVFRLYSAPDASSKAIIRNSLPLYIAEPVFAAWCTIQKRLLADLPQILSQEFERPGDKRVQKMIIRGTSGALFFMRQ